jgi:dihydroneopterin aldolase
MAENAIIVKADKGKTGVILFSDDYTAKVHTFLNDNNFQTIQTNPTDIFQKLLTKTLQQCNLIINKNQIKYLLQKKPQAPTLKAQIKVHKPGNPIRPVINNMNAPAYKISKYLVNKVKEYLNLEHQFTTKKAP